MPFVSDNISDNKGNVFDLVEALESIKELEHRAVETYRGNDTVIRKQELLAALKNTIYSIQRVVYKR